MLKTPSRLYRIKKETLTQNYIRQYHTLGKIRENGSSFLLRAEMYIGTTTDLIFFLQK